MPANLVLGALKHLWCTLGPIGRPMAVMGGLALAAWKHVRATRDVDILIALGTSEVDSLIGTLAKAGIKSKDQSPIRTLGALRIIQLQYEAPGAYLSVQVDLLFADSPYHLIALQRRIPARLPDLEVEISVLSCEDLILHKLLAGRIIDRADAVALLRLNRTALDLGYLTKWSDDLNLRTELAECWQAAFHGESLPG